MTPEEKEKLLVAFCGYLPYKLQIQTTCAEDSIHTLICAYFDDESNDYEYMDNCGISWDAGDFKPYLRPMSSMTEEERQILEKLSNCYIRTKVLERDKGGKIKKQMSYLDNEIEEIDLFGDNDEQYSHVSQQNFIDTSDFFNSHHFDYRGLIPMGLALEAPEGMYNTKTKKI